VAEVKKFKRTLVTNGKANYWQFGQYGGPGIIYRLGDEVGRQLAQAGPRPERAVGGPCLRAGTRRPLRGLHRLPGRQVPLLDGAAEPVRPDHHHGGPESPFPSYPSNAADLGTASTIVLGHLFPREAARYANWARAFGDSRLWAGIHFKSDIEAGHAIGRGVAEKVIERAKTDGAQ
jgi:PAP2 superfamily